MTNTKWLYNLDLIDQQWLLFSYRLFSICTQSKVVSSVIVWLIAVSCCSMSLWVLFSMMMKPSLVYHVLYWILLCANMVRLEAYMCLHTTYFPKSASAEMGNAESGWDKLSVCTVYPGPCGGPCLFWRQDSDNASSCHHGTTTCLFPLCKLGKSFSSWSRWASDSCLKSLQSRYSDQ